MTDAIRCTGLVVLAAALALGGCATGSSSHAAPGAGSSLRAPSTAVSPSDATAAAIGQAVAAYRGMWQAYESAVGVPDPASADLGWYATGEALHTLVSGLQSLKSQGLKGTGTVVHAPEITQLSPSDAPTQVSVQDCMDTSQSHIVRAGPGPAYRDSAGGRRLCLADVRRQDDGGWKVVSFGVRGVGTC